MMQFKALKECLFVGGSFTHMEWVINGLQLKSHVFFPKISLESLRAGMIVTTATIVYVLQEVED